MFKLSFVCPREHQCEEMLAFIYYIVSILIYGLSPVVVDDERFQWWYG